ncbi:MAG TPA: tRNA (adenosine(37)-N6)-dimethylallyltransferase MiaA, partial [Ideonella sp.]|nr:tRNA (adenosine(37)-N6)-dimethylallyltransferase MiaA [Ideonella sp.]
PLISLEPRERGWLHARIAARLRDMLARGFVDEVRALRARGDLHPGLPSMRCVGYRQAWEALDAGTPAALAALPERIAAATRQLARRQLTWLRSMPQRTVVEADAPDAVARTVAAALALAPGR